MRAEEQSTLALPADRLAASAGGIAVEDGARLQFLKCVEQSALGESWEVLHTDGRRLAYVLPANDDADRALEFLSRLKHDSLPPITPYLRQHRPVIVVNVPVQSLRDRFRDCWSKGMSGIPKKELLPYMKAAATALDQLTRTERVQHLGLRPETLLLHDGNIFLGQYGFMHFLWLRDRDRAGVPNPRYAAPELFHPHISSRCDQYSLALIYAEMLTGVHPLRHQRDLRRGAWLPPDLGLLAAAEREIVAKALSTTPSQRFSNTTEFIDALSAVDRDSFHESAPLEGVVEIDQGSRGSRGASIGNSLDYFVSEMLLSMGAPHALHQVNNIRYKLEPGRLLEHHCAVRLFPGGAMLKLEGFRQHWQAQRVHDDDGVLVFRLSLPPTFWQKLTGRRMGLEIQVQVAPGTFEKAHRSEIVVLIRPYGCSGQTAVALLNELGPKILESLRGYLHAQPEQRLSERLPCNEPVRVLPVVSEVEMAEPIECVTKDISSTGIGFFLAKLPPGPQVYINLPKVPELARYAGLAEIVRTQPCGDGWFEVGARFASK